MDLVHGIISQPVLYIRYFGTFEHRVYLRHPKIAIRQNASQVSCATAGGSTL